MTLPINAFTIVLNGEPWLWRVYQNLCQLGSFRWTVVHGIADPVGDTGWCKRLPDGPDDGTLEMLQGIALSDQRVQVIAQPRWPGKTAMCNTALRTFDRPGVLLQIDADEIWTPTQLSVMPSLFERHPDAHAAMFLCRYWVGPRRYVATPNRYGNHCAYEWVRAWRFEPGMRFETHEPPILSGASRYITHAATAQLGLVFDHYAYTDRKQVAFKEQYYGYAGAVEAWERLQEMRGPVDLCGVLPWVKQSVISYEG